MAMDGAVVRVDLDAETLTELAQVAGTPLDGAVVLLMQLQSTLRGIARASGMTSGYRLIITAAWIEPDEETGGQA